MNIISTERIQRLIKDDNLILAFPVPITPNYEFGSTDSAIFIKADEKFHYIGSYNK